jgi:uncharacterized protein YbjT (DUF2867 family)
MAQPESRTSVPQPVIAVAGATGDLGSRLTDAFLSPELLKSLSKFIAIVRRQTPATDRWKAMGAEIRIIQDGINQDDLVAALDGVDVLVNA